MKNATRNFFFTYSPLVRSTQGLHDDSLASFLNFARFICDGGGRSSYGDYGRVSEPCYISSCSALLVQVALVFYFRGISTRIVSSFYFLSLIAFCFFWIARASCVSLFRFLDTKGTPSFVSLKSLSLWLIDFLFHKLPWTFPRRSNLWLYNNKHWSQKSGHCRFLMYLLCPSLLSNEFSYCLVCCACFLVLLLMACSFVILLTQLEMPKAC